MTARVLAGILTIAVAFPLRADPLLQSIAGHWRPDTQSMTAGGTFAPARVLGDMRPDSPTSLPVADRPTISLHLTTSIPVTYVHGNRRFAEMRVDSRELRAAVPLAADPTDARWWLGYSLGATSARISHRDRWLHDRARARGPKSTTALAWRDGPWTLGVARRDSDLAGSAHGAILADLQQTRRGEESMQFDWRTRSDTVGAAYARGRWCGGVEVTGHERKARAALDIAEEPFAGVFSTERTTVRAWAGYGRVERRWFAYAISSDLDAAPGAIASGDAIRGRTSLSGDSTVLAIGRRCSDGACAEHIELSWIEHTLDFSGRISDGVLGSLDGQITGSARARTKGIAIRWGTTRRAGPWRWTLAASGAHTRLDFEGRAVDIPGAFQTPDWEWHERLEGGEAWLGSLTLGLGREIDGWRVDAQYTLLGGDTRGDFQDLTEPEVQPAWQRDLPPDPPTGPSPTLDLGWVFSVEVSHDL